MACGVLATGNSLSVALYKTPTIRLPASHHENYPSLTNQRSRDELIRDVLQWTPAYDQAKAGRPARTYIQQLCEDMGCNSEDLPKAMNDWEKWRERVRDIRATSPTWWWWWWSIYSILNIGKYLPPISLSFLDKYSQSFYLSKVRLCAQSSISLSLGTTILPLSTLGIVLSILLGDCPDIYFFDKI